MSPPPVLLWLRRDLRLGDHPALRAALAGGGRVWPVFIWSPEEEGSAAPGAASRWWLHHSLAALDADLRRVGSGLILRRGPALTALRALVQETGATSVFWSRRYEPDLLERDKAVKAALTRDGLEVRSFLSALLWEPWTVLTQQEKPYQVFTPYYRACLASGDPPAPLPAPEGGFGTARKVASLPLAELNLLPRHRWDAGLASAWIPGEAGGWKRLRRFGGIVAGYSEVRDRPDLEGTSRLSPHLHFGELSPRQIWAELKKKKEAAPYLRQLIWREFAHQLLFHFPHTVRQPLRPEFSHFPWQRAPHTLRAWQRGRTGFPIVDAGLRELWYTGWMHNRVRMIVASFLVKDLLLPWTEGAAWFWDTLVDADQANNTLGWQWTAGCGADAAPYFRVFNPWLQGAKFDPDGTYIRRWLPELAGRSTAALHQPPTSPADGYPTPVVDHALARDRALAAYREIQARRLDAR